jgi:hypothetical protein
MASTKELGNFLGRERRRVEITVDPRKVLDGAAAAVAMRPGDILYVSSGIGGGAGLHGTEAAVQMGTDPGVRRR